MSTAPNPKVDFYFTKAKAWQQEYALLREICLSTELEEELKWGVPCYTLDKKNVVLIHGFKDYCALLFHKGALIKDKDHVLIQQTENVQAARQLRFASVKDISKQKTLIKEYIQQAIQLEKEGIKVPLKKTTEFAMPDEFAQQLKSNPKLKKAFEALTPGRQRAYLLFFSQAKQAKTREARVEKYIPQILAGKGIDD